MSRERQELKERMGEYGSIIQMVRRHLAEKCGIKSFPDLRNYQDCVKKCLHIPTHRIDWRTKKGIYLWFCENWEQISINFDKIEKSWNKYSKKEKINTQISQSVVESNEKNENIVKNEEKVIFIKSKKEESMIESDVFDDLFNIIDEFDVGFPMNCLFSNTL